MSILKQFITQSERASGVLQVPPIMKVAVFLKVNHHEKKRLKQAFLLVTLCSYPVQRYILLNPYKSQPIVDVNVQ